jgi:hypothetical protein
MTPPSPTRAAKCGELIGIDRGEVEQHVDRLADRFAHLARGVVDDLVGTPFRDLGPVPGAASKPS